MLPVPTCARRVRLRLPPQPMRAELGPVRARGGYPGGFTNLTEVGTMPRGKKWIYKKSVSSSGTKNWFLKLMRCWWANRAGSELPTPPGPNGRLKDN